MNLAPSNRITPWVLRLIIANAVVLLLMRTVFTSAALAEALAFSPGGALHRPWTFLSYMFVHAGLLHLLGNMLMLYVFGTAVEGRMGSRAFVLYYLLCGVGAAVFALGLSGVMAVSPFIGASGAVLGVALAFAMYWPDAELVVFPIPVLTRDMPLGTRRLREDLQRERGVSVEEAEQMIRGGERNDLLDPFVATRGDELATGIERAAAFLQSSSRSGGQISRLYLVGGGARVPGLTKVLADRLRVPVELANPLGRLNVADGVFDELNMDEVAPLLMLPIGLALRTAA